MNKGLISIFALPEEIDSLQLTLYNLRRNSVFLPDTYTYGIDLTLCLSDELTDWEHSKLPKEYFEEKFNDITRTLLDWATIESAQIRYDNQILGCVSQRRHSLQYLDKYDFTMWLDTDLFFTDKLLVYMSAAQQVISQNGIEYYIITPQITRQWDDTWDVIVHDTQLNKPLNHNKNADVFALALTEYGKLSVNSLPIFKAAGGWATAFSNSILRETGIPDALGHYGLEDTYVINCSQFMHHFEEAPKPCQFVLENVIVGENHKNQTKDYLRKMLCSIDRKSEYRNIAIANFEPSLRTFNRKYQK